ncbi:hypothetical protein LguiB_021068 [Lonicera macranthoides]
MVPIMDGFNNDQSLIPLAAKSSKKMNSESKKSLQNPVEQEPPPSRQFNCLNKNKFEVTLGRKIYRLKWLSSLEQLS